MRSMQAMFGERIESIGMFPTAPRRPTPRPLVAAYATRQISSTLNYHDHEQHNRKQNTYCVPQEDPMPVDIKPLSIHHDHRLHAYCVTATCSYGDFLQITAGAEQNLNIQRAIIKGTKAYATLRKDLRRGCVLPPVVLAIDIDLTVPIETPLQNGDYGQLSRDFAATQSEQVYIIDGLQRTNAIRQTMEELNGPERDEFAHTPLRVELWVNISFGAIAYRMLLLNAGQRPMSVKHQVEVLSAKLADELANIPHIDIFRIGDARRRAQPGQFPLSKLAQGFQAWLQGQPNLDLRNTVMEELLAESAVEVLGQAVSVAPNMNQVGGFSHLVAWIVQLDFALGPERLEFLGNDTVLLGIAAAVGAFERNDVLAPRVWPALDALLVTVRANPERGLALQTYRHLLQGIEPSKVNVGLATREMVFNAFKEYIRAAGESPMSECWQIGAARG